VDSFLEVLPASSKYTTEIRDYTRQNSAVSNLDTNGNTWIFSSGYLVYHICRRQSCRKDDVDTGCFCSYRFTETAALRLKIHVKVTEWKLNSFV
jgi:hypothetical protein